MQSIKMAYARQPGTYHLMHRLPCQDAVYGCTGPEAACIALADGAGSIPDSQYDAESAVQSVARELSERFDAWFALPDGDFAPQFVDFARKAVKAAYPERYADCTLLAAAAAPDGRLMLCHMGDGVIFGIRRDGGSVVLSAPDNGEMPNQTFFLSSKNAVEHMRRVTVPAEEYRTVLLCSDGAAAVLRHADTGAVAPAVGIMADWLETYDAETVSEILAQNLDQVFRNQTSDDMSIAMLSLPAMADGGEIEANDEEEEDDEEEIE